MRRSALTILIIVALLVPVTVQALPLDDILLTSTLPVGHPGGARLHTGSAGTGPQAYDIKANGNCTVTFYRRNVSGPANMPRDTVRQTWVYYMRDNARGFDGASYADSAAVTDWGTATEVIVTGRTQ